jgi:hypothetical protein
MIMVGDRGMITSARIKALRELPGMAWITCLRGPAVKKLMAGDGPLQLSLFDEQDLAEITSPDYPGERLIACRNPFLAQERARKREDLLRATEEDLRKIAAQIQAGKLAGQDKIGLRAGKIINKRKVAKHLILDIASDRLSWRRDQAAIDAEAATDGIYVIRTPVPAETLDAPGTVTAYKGLSRLETGKPQCCHSRGWSALSLVPSRSVFMTASWLRSQARRLCCPRGIWCRARSRSTSAGPARTTSSLAWGWR